MKECECGGVGPCQCEEVETSSSCGCTNCTCHEEVKVTIWQKVKNIVKSFFKK